MKGKNEILPRKKRSKVAVFWFRRDLRLDDNVGLYQALSSGFPVLPLFIFDEAILASLSDKKDRRVNYMHQALTQINLALKLWGSALKTLYGSPVEIFRRLADEFDIQLVFCNRDYEPRAIQRDIEIYHFLKEHNITFRLFKDQVIFDKDDVIKRDGNPYTIYTPYSKKWKQLLATDHYKTYQPHYANFFRQQFTEILSLDEIGFAKTDITFEIPTLDAGIIGEYDKFRDFPALQKTTGLGVALRFGTISIRKCLAFAVEHNQTWLNELIWREFFMQILYHFPHVEHQSFKKRYDHIKWRNDEQEFEQWCQGKTGYPIVDAGMRQLNATGYMHNRVRMIAASFLCKHLLIDWRWGEAYFAQKLIDYELSANNGNWQWASGSGCDAAPYFRVFNPVLQTAKFDKNLVYIKRWLPEFDSESYAKPIVEHSFARERALKIYAEAFSV